MGVKKQKFIKCPVGHCNEEKMECGTWCVTHTQEWMESPEQKRAVAVGDLGMNQDRLHTAFGDFIRRIEAEKRNYGNEEKK
jgi:hypothetical protein